MPEMRYRKPSVKTMLGVTKWKKRVKKALGITAVMKPFRMIGNYKRKVLRQAGYYRPEMKAMRAMKKGQVAGPLGAIQVGEHAEKGHGADDSSLLMAAMLSQQANGEHEGHHEREPENKALLMAAALSGEHGKGDEGGSGLAQAMLLAAALGGSDEKKAPASKRSRAKAAEAGETKKEERSAPKRSRK
jgi:hypothetical protein